MGEAELDKGQSLLVIHADLFFYGNAANDLLSKVVAADIEKHWNEPMAAINIKDQWFNIQFRISGTHAKNLQETDVFENTNPRNNYFRINLLFKYLIMFNKINCFIFRNRVQPCCRIIWQSF